MENSDLWQYLPNLAPSGNPGWSSVKSGAWLRRFDDVSGVAKTDILR